MIDRQNNSILSLWGATDLAPLGQVDKLIPDHPPSADQIQIYGVATGPFVIRLKELFLLHLCPDQIRQYNILLLLLDLADVREDRVPTTDPLYPQQDRKVRIVCCEVGSQSSDHFRKVGGPGGPDGHGSVPVIQNHQSNGRS